MKNHDWSIAFTQLTIVCEIAMINAKAATNIVIDKSTASTD